MAKTLQGPRATAAAVPAKASRRPAPTSGANAENLTGLSAIRRYLDGR